MAPWAAPWTSCDVLHGLVHLRIAADGVDSGESARAWELEHPTVEEDHLVVAGRHTAGHRVVVEGHHKAVAAVAAVAGRMPAAAAAAVGGRCAEHSWDGNFAVVMH